MYSSQTIQYVDLSRDNIFNSVTLLQNVFELFAIRETTDSFSGKKSVRYLGDERLNWT